MPGWRRGRARRARAAGAEVRFRACQRRATRQSVGPLWAAAIRASEERSASPVRAELRRRSAAMGRQHVPAPPRSAARHATQPSARLLAGPARSTGSEPDDHSPARRGPADAAEMAASGRTDRRQGRWPPGAAPTAGRIRPASAPAPARHGPARSGRRRREPPGGAAYPRTDPTAAGWTSRRSR